jgi:TonB family protein
MKNNFLVFALLFSFAIWQGCGSKSQEATSESVAKAAEAKKIEAVAAKRAMIEEERVRKAEQRSLAAAEKLKLSLTYTDAHGKIIYNKAEIDPSYTGGPEELKKYLKDNLKYPAEARDNGIEGTVFVDFVVDAKGNVREVVATDAVGEDVDFLLKEESVRVVAAMPGWKAGMQNGKTVDTSFSIPITFEIAN